VLKLNAAARDRMAIAAGLRRGQFMLKSDTDAPDKSLAFLKQGRQAPADADVAALRAAVTAAAGFNADDLRPFDGPATFHAVYEGHAPDGRAIMVRASVTSHQDVACAMVLSDRIHSACASVAVSTPGQIACDMTHEHVSYDFEVVDRIQGTSLDRLEPQEDAFRARLADVGEALARCHLGVPTQGFGLLDPCAALSPDAPLTGTCATWAAYLGNHAEEHIHILRDHAEIDGETASRITERFAELSNIDGVSPCLLHGDCTAANIMLDGSGGIVLLDWEDALSGDPLFDLAALATFHPVERHPHIFEGYRRVRPTPRDQARAYWLYFLRISVAKQVHRIRFGLNTHPRHERARQRIFLALGHLESTACAYC